MEYLRSIWDTLVGCFNCQESHSNQRQEPNERTCLIDPVSHSQAVHQSTSDDFIREYPSSLPKKEEQTALSRIVQETASNIIDVAAMDSHNLEPQEYTDRVKLYSQKLKLAQQWNIVKHPTAPGPKGLLADVPAEAMLKKSKISTADLQMIKSFVQKAAIAVNDIRVEHRDDLIVPFRI